MNCSSWVCEKIKVCITHLWSDCGFDLLEEAGLDTFIDMWLEADV